MLEKTEAVAAYLAVATGIQLGVPSESWRGRGEGLRVGSAGGDRKSGDDSDKGLGVEHDDVLYLVDLRFRFVVL